MTPAGSGPRSRAGRQASPGAAAPGRARTVRAPSCRWNQFRNQRLHHDHRCQREPAGTRPAAGPRHHDGPDLLLAWLYPAHHGSLGTTRWGISPRPRCALRAWRGAEPWQPAVAGPGRELGQPCWGAVPWGAPQPAGPWDGCRFDRLLARPAPAAGSIPHAQYRTPRSENPLRTSTESYRWVLLYCWTPSPEVCGVIIDQVAGGRGEGADARGVPVSWRYQAQLQWRGVADGDVGDVGPGVVAAGVRADD